MVFENLYLNIYPAGGQPYAVRLSEYGKMALNVGRHQVNHIVIDTQGVSDFHGWIVWENGQVLLIDNSSTGGIYLNGARVQDRQIFQPGDVAQLGSPASVMLTLGLAAKQVAETVSPQRYDAQAISLKSVRSPMLIYIGLLILCFMVLIAN